MLTDDRFKSIFPFSEPRHSQRDIIEKIVSLYESGKKYIILNAPTGIGKSAIGLSLAKYFGNAYILTSQKVLQEQYYKDFGIPKVLGKSNYQCQQNFQLSCELGACYGIPMRRCRDKNGVVTCPYIVAKETCLKNSFSNLNYSYFFSIFAPSSLENRDTEDHKRRIIVCDECHNLEAELMKQCTVTLNEFLLKSCGLRGVKMPREGRSDEYKIDWLKTEVMSEAERELKQVTSTIATLKRMPTTSEYKKMSTKKSSLERLVKQISLMFSNPSSFKGTNRIVIAQDDKKIEFKPLYCQMLFSTFLKPLGERMLFMSASVLDKDSFIKNLGISADETEYIECDSIFPVENRLITYLPVGSMSMRNKAETLPKMVKKIREILDENRDVKGIIHTVSYDIAEKVMSGLSSTSAGERLLMPRGSSREEILSLFYDSDKPYVLISPSLMEGIDLKEDLSRLCIICKVPYGNLGDEWTRLRMENSKQWYIGNACVNLVQMTGRSIRTETDFAKTYILDSDFIRLASQADEILPRWWKEAVVVGS